MPVKENSSYLHRFVTILAVFSPTDDQAQNAPFLFNYNSNLFILNLSFIQGSQGER